MNTGLRVAFLCLSFICCLPSFSQSPTAEEVALRYLSNKLAEEHQPEITRFDRAKRIKSIWVFENLNPVCFVLVKEATPPYVVGYSLHQPFLPDDPSSTPIPMVLDCLDSIQVNHASQQVKTAYQPIGPMLQTHWGQDEYFNFLCPSDESSKDKHVLTGCAVVAMSQILRYYGKFNKFAFQVTYQNPKYGLLQATMGNFQWEQMEDAPLTIDLETCRFMYALGILTEMAYGPTMSTTSTFMAYDGFKRLGYLDAKRTIRIETDSVDWTQTIIKDIYDYKPVYIAGSRHAFVCDGIDCNGLLHMNMGWAGYADGYYTSEVISGLSVTEALCDIKPYSSLLPPVDLKVTPNGGYSQFSWSPNPQSPMSPINYRVYLNDTILTSTLEPHISSQEFPPGNHTVKVSAVYTSGESRWIGPLYITVKGSAVLFEDSELKALVESEYNKQFTPPTTELTSEQAQLVRQLTIPGAIRSLKGLEACKKLQILSINGYGQELDFGPITYLKKLKSLQITQVKPIRSNLLANCTQLSEFSIDNNYSFDISWISNWSDLIRLTCKNMNLSKYYTNLNFNYLENITFSNCQLDRSDFIVSLPRLAHLDLSNNRIQSIDWSDTLATLRDCDLSGNRISAVDFIDKIPGIKKLILNHNQIEQWVPQCPLISLESLDLSDNQIDTVHFIEPASQLKYLYLATNQLKSLSDINKDAPSLLYLDLSHNQLEKLWDGCLQNLQSLNIADNQITHLIRVPYFSSLTHLECQNNRITDIYPLVSKEFYNQLTFLDLTSNPLSTEAIEYFMPRILSQVDTMFYPGIAEKLSPGYPIPARGQTLSGSSATLSWTTSAPTCPVFYELWMGNSPDKLILIDSLLDQPADSVGISPGREYFWMVKSVTPDTSFFGGIFHFRTFTPISLPFNETFETRVLSSYISDLTHGWIAQWNDSTAITDGRIIDSYVYEGSRAMSIVTQSGVQLPLNHLVQKTLRIKMQMMVNGDCSSCVKFLNINGSDLILFFRPGGRCDIYFDQQFVNQVNFPIDQWFQLALTAYGTSGNVQLKIGRDTYGFPWLFPDGNVCIGEMDLCCLSGSLYAQEAYDQFFIDNLNITAQNVVYTREISLSGTLSAFPNPTNQYVNIALPSSSSITEPVVFNQQGKKVPVYWKCYAPNEIRLQTDLWPVGLYYVTFPDRPRIRPISILVAH